MISLQVYKRSSRLQYVLDWIFRERLGIPYQVFTLEEELPVNSLLVITYSSEKGPGKLMIPDSGLLWETGIREKETLIRFSSAGEPGSLPPSLLHPETGNIQADFFALTFFLLSRYEEYRHFIPDKHGRYPAANSLLYRCGLLQEPLLDIYLRDFELLLAREGGFLPRKDAFTFLPTYDIDIAYSYLYKGVFRNIGGALRDLLKGERRLVAGRARVLTGSGKDPYDAYDFLKELHYTHALVPLYFVLAALHRGPFDKNIHPLKKGMCRLIRHFAEEGRVGLHPSYHTDKDHKAWQEEKQTLEKCTSEPVWLSRQHFIKMRVPETYRYLLENGITEDFSMGFATHLGFRAGTGSSFFWYDLEREKATELRVHPFCFMDATAHYEAGLSAEEAFAQLEAMAALLIRTGSQLITVFHNFSLGTDPEWQGWQAAYARFVQEMTGPAIFE